jgi:hypothetical protein
LRAAVHPFQAEGFTAVASDQVKVPQGSDAVDAVRVCGIAGNEDPTLKNPIPLRDLTKSGVLAQVEYRPIVTTEAKAGAKLVSTL